MLKPTLIVSSLALLLTPLSAFAHPGHADGMPIAHAMSHALHYLIALVAAVTWSVPHVTRLIHAKFDRKRSRH
jgi:hypothetical protein